MFCDSYTKDNSDKVLSEVKVCSPHETYRQYPKAIYVVASSYRSQILKFIKDDPILNSIQTFYYNSDPDSCEYQAFIYATIYLREVVHQDSYVCNYLKFFDYFQLIAVLTKSILRQKKFWICLMMSSLKQS